MHVVFIAVVRSGRIVYKGDPEIFLHTMIKFVFMVENKKKISYLFYHQNEVQVKSKTIVYVMYPHFTPLLILKLNVNEILERNAYPSQN